MIWVLINTNKDKVKNYNIFEVKMFISIIKNLGVENRFLTITSAYDERHNQIHKSGKLLLKSFQFHDHHHPVHIPVSGCC